MSVGQELWVVATGAGEGADDRLLGDLKRSQDLRPKTGLLTEPCAFKVPKNLTFGSFDNLVRLTDDLAKFDAQCDSIVHRFERQYLEIDPNAKFQVKHQRQAKDLAAYLQNWEWDGSKFSLGLPISDILTILSSVVNKLDEEARIKTAQLNDIRSQKSNISKKPGGNLLGMDLIDVLTPETVSMGSSAMENDDFIYTEHLTTVVIIIPRGGEAEFLKSYESFNEKVVPQSAKSFDKLADKDGNTLWRVVVFKSEADNFKRQCRERRVVPRDFEYSAETYKNVTAQRAKLQKDCTTQEELVTSLYKAAWSDAMVSWVHLKAMRVFVESVLRFGHPPKFSSFIVTPKPTAVPAARKALAGILGQGQGMAGDAADDDEDFYPYVSLSMSPFTAPRA